MLPGIICFQLRADTSIHIDEMSSKTDFKFSAHTANWIWNFQVHILQQQPNQRVQQKRNTDEEITQTTKTLIKLIKFCMIPGTQPAG